MEAMTTAGVHIGGEERPASGGEWLDSIDPATERPWVRVARGTARDVDDAVAAARSAQPDWERAGPTVRGRLLQRLAGLVEENAAELAALEARDVGKPLHEAVDDVRTTAGFFRYYGEAADKLLGDRIAVDGGFAVTDRVAYGVTGHVTPWNYPLMLLGRTLAPALAMGNATVLKPAEETSVTSVRIASLAAAAGIPDGVVNVVPGRGAEAGAALAAHPDVDHLSFTGSRATGIAVMHASADVMRPVMSELGGKCPAVVFDDVDLNGLVPTLRNAWLWNNGQSCNGLSRVLVARPLLAGLVEALAADIAQLSMGPALQDCDLATLVSRVHHERVLGHIDAARADGARIVTGGGRPVNRPSGYFLEPTIVVAGPASRVATEEVFGPVLAVVPFDDEDDAVAIANRPRYDLASAVFTADVDRAFRVADRLRAGQVYVNNWTLGMGLDLPFGGLRHSGSGREKGLTALAEYSALRTTIVRVGR